ncbi:MAG TPA: hypothetical protein VMU04_24490 [Candidatus Acidoferrum sp.]|nr:hypothetical protein [Candidatus Acidoferrum sp.]
MKTRTRRLLWVCGIAAALAGVVVVLWVRQFHEYTPAEALRDLEAAARVGAASRPVERFLQLRYGPMDNPANRQKAFLDFFNIGHIKGLNMIVARIHPEKRQARIDAMAQWVADYRATMSPEEKASLGAYLNSDAGRATIQQAAAEYMHEDSHFRASTAGVVQELLTTVSTVRRP